MATPTPIPIPMPMPSSTLPSSSSSSSSVPVAKGTIGRNVLCVPSSLTDPFTSYDLDITRGYIVTGTVSGRITSWRVDHLLENKYTKADIELKGTTIRSTNDGNGVSDDTKTAAAAAATVTSVPSSAVTASSSVVVASPAAPSIQPINNDLVRIHTTPLPYEVTEYVCRVLCASSEEAIKSVQIAPSGEVTAVIGDLHVQRWRSCYDSGFEMFKFRRGHNYLICTSTYTMVHNTSILLLTAGNMDCFIIDLLHNPMGQTIRVGLPRRGTPTYFDGARILWVDEKLNGTKVVEFTELQSEKMLATITFTRKDKFYSGFQISGNRMAHICCHFKLKVWDISNTAAPLYRIVAHKHGRVLAFLFTDNGNELISLGSDRKVKVWRNGKLVGKYLDIRGTFQLNYPYRITYHQPNTILYTADDGIYMLTIA